MLVTGSLTVLSLFKLRRSEPHTKRPYRSFCYPLLPTIYLLASACAIGVKVVEALSGEAGGYFPLIGLLLFALAFSAYLGWDRFKRIV
jgi:amino acid transporter